MFQWKKSVMKTENLKKNILIQMSFLISIPDMFDTTFISSEGRIIYDATLLDDIIISIVVYLWYEN